MISASLPMSADVVIESQHPAACMDECVSMLNATRKSTNARERFEWLYLQNPDGPAVVWLARVPEQMAPVGFAAVLPRRMLLQGRVVRCWNCCDLSVLPEFQRRGVATLLRSQARRGIDAGQADFLYGHPNARAAGAHRAAGHSALGTMVRVAMPITLRQHLQKVVRSERLAARLSKLLSPCWRPKRLVRSSRQPATDHIRGVKFDRRFDELFRRVARTQGIVGIRDSQYLAWRYAANPLERTDAVIAAERSQLQGYVLFSLSRSMLQIKDLMTESLEAATRLLDQVLGIAVKEAVDSVSFTALSTHPALNWLRQIGFHTRPETSEVFVYTSLQGEQRQTLLDADHWLMSVGDRDV